MREVKSSGALLPAAMKVAPATSSDNFNFLKLIFNLEINTHASGVRSCSR